jgi:hypothetical protein
LGPEQKIVITVSDEMKMAKKQGPREKKGLTPSTQTKELAMYLASVVRNANAAE